MTRARDLSKLANSITSLDNGNVGVGSTIPKSELNVVGVVSATSFYGDGTNLSNTGSTLSAASGTERVVLTSLTSGTMTASSTDANVTYNATTQTLSVPNVSIAGTLTYEDVTNVDSVGLITARNGAIINAGTATTALIVEGDARVTGILTIGTSSITLDGTENQVNVGTGVTLHHTNGVQVGENAVHSTGITVNNVNVTGILTAASFSGDGSGLTGVGGGTSITDVTTSVQAVGIGSTSDKRVVVSVDGIERIRTANIGFGTLGQTYPFLGIGITNIQTSNGNVRNLISIGSSYNNVVTFQQDDIGYSGILEFRRTGRNQERFAQIQAGTDSNDQPKIIVYGNRQGVGYATKIIETFGYTGNYENKIGLFGSNPDNIVGVGRSAYLSIDVGNAQSEPSTGLRVTRNYIIHPGKVGGEYLYAIQGCLNGSGTHGTNKRDMGGVYGYTGVENTGGVVGQVQGSVYTNGIAVLADAEQSNTDGYGITNAFWANVRNGSGATNGRLRGMYLDFTNYVNQEGIVWNTAYSGGNTLSIARWVRNGNQVGSITCTTSSTTYGTSSDYRLKENVIPLTNAIDRLKQIPVHRFNFISDPNKTVDGFIAHEVTPFVPEAVTGEKDGFEKVPVLDENNQPVLNEDGTQVVKDEPVYQSIDQSKLVPLLTAALQEALDKIDALQARLDAAGL